MLHGNIRCENVFVAEHTDTSFKVKLGGKSLADEYGQDEVYNIKNNAM